MPAEGAIRVEGLRAFNRVLRKADRETRLGIRKAERKVAEPVKITAQLLAVREISHMRTQGTKVDWSRMRIGVTQRIVYVAPKERGRRSKANRNIRRPNLAGLLMDKAMQPALDRNRELVRQSFQHELDVMAANFNRGHT